MAIIEKLPAQAEEVQAFASRIRRWAEADDGKPVFMLNLIRFHPQLRTFAGAPEFKGTPEEANAYYEKSITLLWLTHAAYPIFAGASQAKNLINIHPEREWGRVVVCRYPSRRTFLKLLSDPSYAPMEPYKFIALEVDLVPVSGHRLVPDLRLIVGVRSWLSFWLLAGSGRLDTARIKVEAGGVPSQREPIPFRTTEASSNLLQSVKNLKRVIN